MAATGAMQRTDYVFDGNGNRTKKLMRPCPAFRTILPSGAIGVNGPFLMAVTYPLYLDLLAHASEPVLTAIWSFCLMPNSPHFIAMPSEEDGLRKTLRNAHRH